jgi:hypothetical protein
LWNVPESRETRCTSAWRVIAQYPSFHVG